MGNILRFTVFLWLTLIGILPAFAAPAGTITLLDGKGSFIRGAATYSLVEGVHVEKGDIVELAEQSFANIELNGGTMAALGPQTRVMLLTSAKAGGNEIFLLRGQMKFVAPPNIGGPDRITTPNISVAFADAIAVLQSNADKSSLFMERGDAKILELSGENEGAARILKNGEFYSRNAAQKGEMTPRPSADFVADLPKIFLDKLPSRLDKFKDQKIELKKLPDFTYADVEAWLKGPVTVRKLLVIRWRAKAHDAAFRKGLVANLRDHPEWDRILFPEKYDTAAKKKDEAAAPAKADQAK